MLRRMSDGKNAGTGASGCHSFVGRQIMRRIMHEILPLFISRTLKDN